MTLTAADYADTGQWRLVIEIGYTRLKASLENTLYPEVEPQLLCETEWEYNRDKLRENIEDAVYRNPRLLEDFATRIILYDPRTLFIPTELAEEKEGAEEEIYQKIYSAQDEDIITDRDRDITAAWSLAPGLKGFLMRTFPGARITCNLLDKVRSLRKINEGHTVFVFARGGECDVILLGGKDLLSASTHEYTTDEDMAYLVANLIDVYKLDFNSVKVITRDVDTSSPGWQYILAKSKHENN